MAEKQEKQRLVVFEYPELYTSLEQMKNLEQLICDNIKNSVFFIIITSYNFFKNPLVKNIVLNDDILNEYNLYLLYDTAEEKMPFVFNETEFDTAVKTIIDNWHGNKGKIYAAINSLPVKSMYLAAFLCAVMGIEKNSSYLVNDAVLRFIKNI